MPFTTIDTETILFLVDSTDLVGTQLVGHFLFPILEKMVTITIHPFDKVHACIP